MRSGDWSNKSACAYGIHIITAYITQKRCWKVCFCPSWSQTILALSETKQDWLWFIHLLEHIWTAAASYSSCWAHLGTAPQWSSIIQVFCSLFQSHHLQIREFCKVIMSPQRGCGLGRVVFGTGCRERRQCGKSLLWRWHLTLLLLVCPFRSVGRKWSYRAAIPAVQVWRKEGFSLYCQSSAFHNPQIHFREKKPSNEHQRQRFHCVKGQEVYADSMALPLS